MQGPHTASWFHSVMPQHTHRHTQGPGRLGPCRGADHWPPDLGGHSLRTKDWRDKKLTWSVVSTGAGASSPRSPAPRGSPAPRAQCRQQAGHDSSEGDSTDGGCNADTRAKPLPGAGGCGRGGPGADAHGASPRPENSPDGCQDDTREACRPGRAFPCRGRPLVPASRPGLGSLGVPSAGRGATAAPPGAGRGRRGPDQVGSGGPTPT